MRWNWILVLLAAGCSGNVTPVEEVSVDGSGVSAAPLADFIPADADWPSWRGPDGNGVARSQSVPITWGSAAADGQVMWKAAVPGRGHASPVVCGDLVLLATAMEEEQQQMIVAFDRISGVVKWQTIVHSGGFPADRQVHRKGTHANGTVACDDQHIFTAFLNHDSIVASTLDFEGTVVWQTKLGAFQSKFGYAPSPLMYKSFVIYAADNMGGGYLAALHRRTGEIAWRKARPAISTYSSPVVAHVAGRDQLLISGCDLVSSYDPNTGEPLWTCPGTSEATCGTMVCNESMVFAAGGYPQAQVIGVLADGSGKKIWSRTTKIYEPSMLVVNDHLYGVNDDGVATCWQAATGEVCWKQRLGGSFSASPVLCNGIIYASNADGETFVFRANPDRYEEVARNQLGDDAYATPAICGDRIFLRVGVQQAGKRQEMLYCLGLPETAAEQVSGIFSGVCDRGHFGVPLLARNRAISPVRSALSGTGAFADAPPASSAAARAP